MCYAVCKGVIPLFLYINFMLKVEFIQLDKKSRIDKLKRDCFQFIDTIKDQIDELCEIENPHFRDTPEKFDSLKAKYLQQFSKHSVYCYFPWCNTAIRILKQPYFEKVRTARNKNLITDKEQARFRKARVAIAGLSVGSNIARLSVLQGGPQHMNIADHDTISLTNLNRILAGVADIGRKKTDVLLEDLYEMDPFLKLKAFDDGVRESNLDSFFHHGKRKIDVLVEEIDSLKMKIELRKKAKQYRVPVISIADNADGIIVEVERYDQGYTFSDFTQRLKALPLKDPKTMSTREKAVAITKYIGVKDIPSSMLASILEVGKTLYSWPQLGGSALFAGVVGAYCIRQIACGNKLPSGRYVFALPEMLGTVPGEELKKKQKLLHHFK